MGGITKGHEITSILNLFPVLFYCSRKLKNYIPLLLNIVFACGWSQQKKKFCRINLYFKFLLALFTV